MSAAEKTAYNIKRNREIDARIAERATQEKPLKRKREKSSLRKDLKIILSGIPENDLQPLVSFRRCLGIF
jgi:hypothetical protein